MMFYVYLIQSRKTNELYFGYTADIEQRIFSHNGADKKKHGVPWELNYMEGYRSEHRRASAREKTKTSWQQ